MVASGITLISALAPMNKGQQKTDAAGHVFTTRWKEYYAAVSADRPKKQLEILAEIKALAKENRQAWDFWDAAEKYRSAAISMNWKLRDSLNKQLMEEVYGFDEPVMTFVYKAAVSYCSDHEKLKFIAQEKERLMQSQNKAFYFFTGNTASKMSSLLPEYINNDYEYALWNTLPYYISGSDMSEHRAYINLKETIAGRYPEEAYLEYLNIASNPDENKRKASFISFIEKLKGKAISYYALSDLILMKKDSLDKDERRTEDGYKKLYEECLSFEKERKALTGKEAALVSSLRFVKDLADELTAPLISLGVNDDTVSFIVRNIDYVNFEIYPENSNKAIFKQRVKNEVGSFYIPDNLKLALPKLNDGTYRLYAFKGKIEDECSYEKFRLSLAGRTDNKGRGIYAAAYMTGEPLDKADLRLYKNGKKIREVIDFVFEDGFTCLPEKISSDIEGDSWYGLEVACKGEGGYLLKSRMMNIYKGDDFSYYPPVNRNYCNIYLDRKAYNPGDTVYFKALLYHGDMVSSLKSVEEGRAVDVTLYDSEHNKLESLELKTNEFGSVAGKFTLPKGLRNGMFSIRAVSWTFMKSESFRVDEFVLPTFDLSFEKIEKLYLPGDKVKVKGRVNSYSGHSLSEARLVYRASLQGDVLAEGEAKIEADGSFEVEVNSAPEQDWQYINLNVKIIDPTGETQEYNKGIYVGKTINLIIDLLNAEDALVSLEEQESKTEEGAVKEPFADAKILNKDVAAIKISAKNGQNNSVPLDISYTLYDENKIEKKKGKVLSGDIFELDFSKLPAGLYSLEASVCVKNKQGKNLAQDKKRLAIIKTEDRPESINAPVDHFFWCMGDKLEDGDNMEVMLGSANGDLWAVVELFGDERKLVDKRLVHISGKRGETGSIAKLSYPYKKEYPDAMLMQIFFFRKGEYKLWSRQFRRVKHTLDLPLSFSFFEDKTLPGREYTFKIKTAADVECVASVYDKSLDNIAANPWEGMSLFQFNVPQVYVNAVPGGGGSVQIMMEHNIGGVRGFARKVKSFFSAVAADSEEEAMLMEKAYMGGVETKIEDAGLEAQEEYLSSVAVRDNFANTLAFYPFLRSSSGGEINLDFKTSDKLSTYYVQLFAHDKNIRNSVLSKEMVVSVPVKVSVLEPKFLYAGDEYEMSVSVTSNSSLSVSGTLALYQYAGEDHKGSKPLKVSKAKISVAPGKTVSKSFKVLVPSEKNRASGFPIGLKAVFADEAGMFSDAVFVKVPVYRNVQTLTEAHSAVLLNGMDKEALIAKIRSAFVNVSSYGAEYKEVSVIDMVKDAIPAKANPSGKNVVALSEAYYIRLVAKSLGVDTLGEGEDFIPTDKLLERILACRNADGGFGWFEGMDSSPIITALLLERFAKLRDAGLLELESLELEKSVKFLDKARFDSEWPSWCGGLSVNQYLFVRSLYPSVGLSVQPFGKPAAFLKRMSEFKKYVKEYLVPKEERGLNGYIIDKARRLRTLNNLLSSSDGLALAKSLGLSFGAETKMKKSLQADVVSLFEYAVDHREGGIYYPNVVMPFRGLMEDEAYAHSMLCDLFTSYASEELALPKSASEALRIADGIRIWLMLQKETQKWDEAPAFLDAVNSVLSGSDEIKNVKVLIMSKTFEQPFNKIKAAGNGMTVERKFYREVSGEKNTAYIGEEGERSLRLEEIKGGEVLNKGDKIIAEYKIWNEENRSFVRLSSPREAGLRPVEQLSGMYGWRIRPFYISEWFSFTPRGYRNVKSSTTEYYFDAFPEETTNIREEFFVTQSGVFSAPVLEIESLYAPHYRANSAYSGKLKVK